MAEAPRIPFAQTISARDYTMTSDAILFNYYASKNTNGQMICDRRFGMQVSASVTAGAALGLFAFGVNLLSIVGNTFYVNGISQGTVNSASPYQFTLINHGGTSVFIKNNAAAYIWNGSTLTQVTDPNYPAVTVPGVAWLDGYVFVMDPTDLVWNSNLNTPATWNALNFITGSSSADPGAAITRLYAYVVAFGTYSCSFFYDAGNTPPGSPLLPNLAAQANVGCAIGTSVVATENTIFWIGQTHQKGRRVYMMNGLLPQAVSDQFIDRILNADPLTGVYAYYIEINGHAFYVLTLVASNVTLVYDSSTGMWARWSTSTLGTPQTAVSATVSNGVVTVNLPNHGLSNPAVARVTSLNSASIFLGVFVATVLDANTISYTAGSTAGGGGLGGGVNSAPVDSFAINSERVVTAGAPSGGSGLGQLTVTPYLQNAFNPAFYAFANNTDYLLGAADGHTYIMEQGVSNDNGAFIYGYLRTNAGDFGSNKMKFFPSIEIIADKVQDTAYVGYSDNDFRSFGPFRPVNLGVARTMLKRCAAARRRAFALLYIGSFQVRIYNIELLDMVEGPL